MIEPVTSIREFPADSPLWEVMEKATAAEILWLDPEAENGDSDDTLVLGRGWVKSKVIPELSRRIRLGLGQPARPLMCFEAHHSVRFVYQSRVAEFLFCFYCHTALIVGPDGAHAYVACGNKPRSLLRSLERKHCDRPWWRFRD